jgi:hypothetical protein
MDQQQHMLAVRHGGEEHEGGGEEAWITKDVVVLLHGVHLLAVLFIYFYLILFLN